jgi:acyl carrier protein
MASASRTALDLRQSQPASWFPAIKRYEQQRDWVLNPFSSDSYAFNYPIALRIFGSVDAAALRKSLEAIVRRHEVLRSRFQVTKGELQQLIDPASNISFREVQLSMLSPTDAEARVRDLCARESGYPFDLTQETLLRAKLFQISAIDHVLFLVTHRIAFDDWSASILLRELSILYSHFGAAAPAALKPLPHSYSHFAATLNGALHRRELQPETAFWQTKFRDRAAFEYLETLDLPGSSARTHGARRNLWFSAQTRARIERVASDAQATPFMVLTAVLFRLFATQAADPDAAVSTYATNRNHANLETLIGPFANRIFLRANLSGATSASAVLEKVRDAALEAYSVPSLPYGELLDAFSPAPNPRTQFTIITSDDPVGNFELPFLTVSEFPFAAESTCHDICITLQFRRRGDLVIEFLYRTALFDADTMTMLVQQYETALIQFLDECQGAPAPVRPPEKSWTQTALASLAPSAPIGGKSDAFEARLQKLWGEIFQRNSIGRESSFFDLGGDSLTAVRLLNAMEAECGFRLSLADLWRCPTVALLAAKVRSQTSPIPLTFGTAVPAVHSSEPLKTTPSRRHWGFF